MKKAIAVLLMTAAALAAQASGSTGKTGKKTVHKAVAAKNSTAVQPLTIPKDAVASGNGSFSWTDKQGKHWNYVKTPFGVVRSEIAATPAAAQGSLNGVRAFDEGDEVRFEKSSPFGSVKWEKNKADLTDEERDLVNKQAAGQNGKQD